MNTHPSQALPKNKGGGNTPLFYEAGITQRAKLERTPPGKKTTAN